MKFQIFMNFLVLGILLAPQAGFAEDPALDSREQKVAPTAFASGKPEPVLHWGAI
jgi:hypothetical protein